MATLADVRKIALGMPGASEKRSYGGTCSWTVGGKGFIWERPLGKSDVAALAANGENAPTGAVVGIRTADLEMKDVLLASDAKVFFTIPHFNGYPAVLARLDKMPVKLLREAIVEAWLARAPKRAVDAYLLSAKRA